MPNGGTPDSGVRDGGLGSPPHSPPHGAGHLLSDEEWDAWLEEPVTLGRGSADEPGGSRAAGLAEYWQGPREVRSHQPDGAWASDPDEED